MTEAKEQFRDRLAQILDAKFAEAFRTPEERSPWDMVRPEWKQAMSDMAETVYAQVLRDLLDHIGGMTIHDDVGGSESTDKMLRDFAAERGINLED